MSSPLPNNTADNTASNPANDVSDSTLRQRSPQRTFAQLAVIAVLSLFVATAAIPQYLGGWAWTEPLKLPDASRNALQAIPEKGLTVTGWRTDDQNAIELGKEAWSIQQLSPEAEESSATPVFLLLRPQIYGADQPEVEWIDIKGSQRWETDSYQKLSFDVPAQSDTPNAKTLDLPPSKAASITADFFRAWNSEQTYAVLQWYAWPTGGHPSPTHWFWADQKVQWQRGQRLPWAAVSLWIPIEPISDITPHQALAESVGEHVQRSLMQTVFLSGGDSS